MDGEAPAWAPLRDNYMLTNPKLKDWDKMQVLFFRADSHCNVKILTFKAWVFM